MATSLIFLPDFFLGGREGRKRENDGSAHPFAMWGWDGIRKRKEGAAACHPRWVGRGRTTMPLYSIL